MAKKKPKRVTVKAQKGRKQTGRTTRRRPQAQALPGMEDAGKDQVLDQICRRATGRRNDRADLRAEEASDKQLAAARMKMLGRTVYNRHGSVIKRVAKGETIEFGKGGDANEAPEATTDIVADDDLDNGAGNSAEETGVNA